eukprot:CAMPEP_0114495564 /NCGR_PEP_ID=MMETSP0109-20121206/5280_1 /TAXON_ID=29199 /ORGANISM="Chlorarachnion reptans, Strain CCCM449" /LENGTH=164 /DNA_ID=CAMNT_0001672731 /DNA_START=96 /DNA_END=586 /DNA_ORIENTATION=-
MEFIPELGGGAPFTGRLQMYSDPGDPSKIYWKSSYQYPAHMVWGIPSQPWHETKRNKVCRVLEDSYEQIKSELHRVVEAQREKDDLISRVGERHGEAELVASGEWRDFVLLNDGGGLLEGKYSPQSLCPFTVNLLKNLEPVHSAVQSKIGVAIFSCLSPGTVLA